MGAADPPTPRPPARSSIEEASEKLAAFLKHAQALRDVAATDSRADDDENAPGSEISDRSLIGPPPRVPRWAWIAIAGLSVLAILEGAYIAWLGPFGSRGTLRVFSEPSFAEVRVDGPTRGRTPSKLPQRTIDAPALDAVADADRTVDAPGAPAPPVASTGTIEVRSTPPGAVVVFGGRRRGVTPIKLPDVTPGVHDVEIGGRAGSIVRRVAVVAGRTTVVDVPYGSARP